MPSKVRGRRECRVPAGTRGLVCKMHSRMRTRAYRYSRSSPAFPAQWFYGLCRRSPWRRIPLASIAGELTARVARLGFANLRQLDASNGRQDHTVLPYAASSAKNFDQPSAGQPKHLAKAFKRRSSARDVRSRKTALRTPLAPDAAASTATRPNVRDDGQRPSSQDGMAGVVGVIWVASRSGIFLRPRLDRANQIEVAGENRALAQGRGPMISTAFSSLPSAARNHGAGG